MKLALIGLVAFFSAQAPPVERYTVTLRTPSGSTCTYTIALRIPPGSTGRAMMESPDVRARVLTPMAERCRSGK